MFNRSDGRALDEIRPIEISVGFQDYSMGSALITMGHTKVLCSVTFEDTVPYFLRGSGQGWLTAEYSMLPGSTHTRTSRERGTKSVRGRTHEIQRLIGRSLRNVLDLTLIGEVSFTIDCDVLQADGGTRTAAITCAYVALYQAVSNLIKEGKLKKNPISSTLAGVSIGVLDGYVLTDLCYEEDSQADVDFNIVMTDRMEFVEIQGTAEKKAFNYNDLESILSIGKNSLKQIFDIQKKVIHNL